MESSALPDWTLYYDYAEAHHIDDPMRVLEIVTLRSWLGWLLLGQAHASRRAYEKAARSEEWAKDMTPEDKRAMDWAKDSSEE